MDLEITGKRALVLGASRGLGMAIAKSLAAEGAIVFAAARSRDKIESWAQSMDNVHPVECDLSDLAQIDALADSLLADGGADIIVNNGGGPPPGTAQAAERAQWLAHFEAMAARSAASDRGFSCESSLSFYTVKPDRSPYAGLRRHRIQPLKREYAMTESLDMNYVQAQFPGLRKDWIFFDNAGGAQIAKPAADRMVEFLYHRNVQIGGSYAISQAAAEGLRLGREAASVLVNAARPEEIVFGSSTTVLLQNFATAMRHQFGPGDEVIVTMADHESNIGPWKRLEEFGVTVKIWPLNPVTLDLQLADLAPLMTERTRLVCVTHVSNILGKVNPVADFARFVHDHGAQICVDGVAYAPHRPIDVQAWDVDYYVFSLYKAYGPHGAVMYGKYDLLTELDGLYHYFYGKDNVPGKLEPGNPNYEMSYSTVGIVEYLTGLAHHHGAAGNPRSLLASAYDRITTHENLLTNQLLTWVIAP